MLAALPQKESRRFLSSLTTVELSLGQVLCKQGTTSRYVYFPNDCTVSLLAVADRGALEVGLVGAEGMVGIAAALGASGSPLRAMVQGAGSAMRITASRFRRELERNRRLRLEMDRCAHVAMATAMQVAVCNKQHVLEARLARWLLMTRDRMTSDEFPFTQQFIALMLGVRRTGVTIAAGAPQRRGLIRYRRGRMQILDRQRLRAASCSCYDVIRRLETSS